VSLFSSLKERQKTKEKVLVPRKKRGSWGIWLATVVSFLAFFFILRSFLFEWERKRAVDKEIAALQKQIEQLKKENTDMQKALRYLNTSEFQEKELKDKLNLIKAGEQVIYIKEEKDKKEGEKDSILQEGNVSTTEVSIKKPNYYYWWQYFFQIK